MVSGSGTLGMVGQGVGEVAGMRLTSTSIWLE